jgi:hypothetical protein
VHTEIHYNGTRSEVQQWRQDASTLSETEYVEKHYAKATMVWLPMERYLGLRTGQLLLMVPLEAVARAQLRPRWKGVQFLDFTPLKYSPN